MESFQSYGVYLIVLGGLLIVAGLIMGYISSLPSGAGPWEIPNRNVPATPDAPIKTDDVVLNISKEEKSEKVIMVNTSPLSETIPPSQPQPDQPRVTGSINIDVIDKLDRLTRLREQGVISVEQYDALRKQLLES